MVERVARVLAIEADHNNWEEFVPDARMAILAMREPTEAMLSALPYPGPEDYPTAIWQAMIDEALK